MAMARKDREETGSRRRRKKSTKKPPAKTPKQKKKSSSTTLAIVVAVVILIWAVFPKEENKGDSSVAVPAIVGILDQIYMGCSVYWYQKGSQNLCTQEIADSLFSSKGNVIKATVVNGEANNFIATSKHNANRIVLFVDSRGDIFIKAKGCEVNIDSLDTAEVNLEELEAQCSTS